MAIQIRKVSAQDAPQLAIFLKEIGWFEFLKNIPLDAASWQVRARIEQCLADNSHSIFVAESSNGTIMGYGSVHWLPYLFMEGPEGYISELFVRESVRGQGVGRQLLQTIETEARDRGRVRLTLINLRNRESYQRQFYLKAGWEERTEAANFIFRIS